jgi:type IV pilus assembly protein PilN
MIRINLLPVRAAQKKEQLRSQIFILVTGVVLTIIVCVGLYTTLSFKIDERKTEVKNKQNEIAQLKKAIGEVDRFKDLKKELQGKLDVLDQLKANRTGPVRLLDELSLAIPSKVWIKSFKESGGNISISGIGLNEETVAEFLQRLEASPYYQGIELQVIEKKQENGREVESFSIVCRVEKPTKE